MAVSIVPELSKITMSTENETGAFALLLQEWNEIFQRGVEKACGSRYKLERKIAPYAFVSADGVRRLTFDKSLVRVRPEESAGELFNWNITLTTATEVYTFLFHGVVTSLIPYGAQGVLELSRTNKRTRRKTFASRTIENPTMAQWERLQKAARVEKYRYNNYDRIIGLSVLYDLLGREDIFSNLERFEGNVERAVYRFSR